MNGGTLMGSICSSTSFPLDWLRSVSFVLQFDLSLCPVLLPSCHRGWFMIKHLLPQLHLSGGWKWWIQWKTGDEPGSSCILSIREVAWATQWSWQGRQGTLGNNRQQWFSPLGVELDSPGFWSCLYNFPGTSGQDSLSCRNGIFKMEMAEVLKMAVR